MSEAVDEIMIQAQVFASAWSLVGGRFDTGHCSDAAKEAKIELEEMVRAALAAAPAQERIDALELEVRQLTEQLAELRHALRTQQPASQGETNVQLDIDSNHSAPGQQRDVARSVALGQPMGNGQDQAAGHLGAQGDKLLTVAERNIRSFLRSATFKSESDREAALNCVDVLWEAARAPADSVLENEK